jgi:hypothetical protein
MIMATDKQISYYESLCNELGQEPDEEFENKNVSEASKVIVELKSLREKMGKFEGKDDNCYWY